ETLARGDLCQRISIEVIKPEMRWRLRVILLERPPGPVATRLHAEEDHPPPIRKKRAWLPRRLIRHLEIEVTQSGAVGVHQPRLSLRCEKETRRRRCPLAARHIRMTTRPSSRPGT